MTRFKLAVLLFMLVGAAYARRPIPHEWPPKDTQSSPTPGPQAEPSPVIEPAPSPTVKPVVTPTPESPTPVKGQEDGDGDWYDMAKCEGKEDTDGDGVCDGYDCAPYDPSIAEGYDYYRDYDLDGLGTTKEPFYSCQPYALDTDSQDYYLSNYGCHIVDNHDDFNDDDHDNDLVPSKQDCDDYDSRVVGYTVYHKDTDGDTMGDSAEPLLACSQPVGYVINACDTNDLAVSLSLDLDFQSCQRK